MFSVISILVILLSLHSRTVRGDVELTTEASILDPDDSAKKKKIHEGVQPAESNGLRGNTHGSLAKDDGSMERNLGACPSTVGPVSWGTYKWNTCLVNVTVDRVLSTTNWQNHFNTQVDNWNQASRIEVRKNNLSYTNSTAWNCSPGTGRIKACNNNYGKTGWLGVAGIWLVSGTNFIARGYVKVNDYYFSQNYYNTPSWRGAVMCQELGHTFGLGHWDTDFSTFCDSCMDYSSDPKAYPNRRDLDFLDNVIYRCTRRLQGQSDLHRAVPDPPGKDGKDFGRVIDDDGYSTTYATDYEDGTWITEVLWAKKKKVS